MPILIFSPGANFGHHPLAYKGQLISVGLFDIFNSPKKKKKKFNFTAMITQVDFFSFVFWKKLKTRKRNFEIN